MCRVYHARAMKFRALSLLALALLPAMGLWFGVSAVAPQIAKEWHLDEGTTAWLTLSVQLGFVAGALPPAPASPAERLPPPPLLPTHAFLRPPAHPLPPLRVHTHCAPAPPALLTP